jgi:hypothetical protein
LAANPEASAIFNAAMAAKAHGQVAGVLDAYDFSGYGTIGDIGGGHGHLLGAILEAVPSAGGVLFDLPRVIEEAKSRVSTDRLRLESGDFFTSTLPTCDCYIVMEVIHAFGNLLELDGGFFSLISGKIGLATNISWKQAGNRGARRNQAVRDRRQGRFQTVDRAGRILAIERQFCLNRRQPEKLDLRIQRAAFVHVSRHRCGSRPIARHGEGKCSFCVEEKPVPLSSIKFSVGSVTPAPVAPS